MTHGTDMAGLSERQRQIINASIKIIAEQSIQQLTIKNLSKRIGISEPAIYRHFESKIDILLAILDSFKETKNSIINKIAVDNMPALEKFEAIFTEHLKIFAANPALAAVIFSEEIFQNEKRLSETVFSIMKMNQQTHMDIIESAQKNKEIKDGLYIEKLKGRKSKPSEHCYEKEVGNLVTSKLSDLSKKDWTEKQIIKRSKILMFGILAILDIKNIDAKIDFDYKTTPQAKWYNCLDR